MNFYPLRELKSSKINAEYKFPVTKRWIAAANGNPPPPPQYACEFGSTQYLMYCSVGGILSCGITHTLVVPLDIVKCRMQTDPGKYKGLISGLGIVMKESGAVGMVRGWGPTIIGYSAQGMGKFGLYELFKIKYAQMVGPETAYNYRTIIYLCASASAEFFADMLLCPFEACKVRIQTVPGYVGTLREAIPKILKEEGSNAFYKGLVPLWCRQIPYTMMKFACFEKTVELIYANFVPKPRAQCSKGEQLIVTFAAGYIAGVFCAVVSHPADTIVSKLSAAKGKSAGQIASELGFAGLMKGLTPRIVMIGTLTALQWFIYDFVKVTLRMPPPPSH